MTHGMTTVKAIVRGVDGPRAIVEVEQGGCGRCHEEGGCGGQNIGQMFCSAPKTYRVGNELGASLGERVTVAVPTRGLRRIATLVYGLPLLATIACALFGAWLGGDLGAILAAALGLVASFVYVRQQAKNSFDGRETSPHIVSRS